MRSFFMERLQQIPYTQVENITYLPGVNPPIESVIPNEIESITQDDPINFIEEKVRRLTWDMFHSGEQRNPLAVARFYELMGKSFAAVAERESEEDSFEDLEKTHARITRLHVLRESFYNVFPKERPAHGIQKSGYDLPADVLNAEEMHAAIENVSPEEKEKKILRFKESKLVDMQTLLGELYNVHDKTTNFSIRNGRLYFDALSKEEPFDKVMAFFVALSEKDNTPESRRHFEELYTYIEIGLWAQNAHVGEQYAMASSPGIVEGTRYTNNYVDVGEIKINEAGQKFVEVTRFKSPIEHEEYKRRFLQEDSHYFDGRDDIPLDAALFKVLYFPKGRFSSQNDLYETIFRRHPDAMDEIDLMNEIVKPCMPYIVDYIEELCNFTSWKNLGRAFRSVRIAAQLEFQKYQQRQSNDSARTSVKDSYADLLVYDIDVRAGAQAVQAMSEVQGVIVTTGGGCGDVSVLGDIFGTSAILNSQNIAQISEMSAIAAFLSNTPGQDLVSSELSDKMGSRVVRCPACNYDGALNIRPKNGFLDGCKNPGSCPNRAAIVCAPKMIAKEKKEEEDKDIFIFSEPENTKITARLGNVLVVNFRQNDSEETGQQFEEEEQPLPEKKIA